MTDDLPPQDGSRDVAFEDPDWSPTRLYGLLSPEARALYEVVPGAQELFRPTAASQGALRRGLRQDDAFRNLLRAAMQGTAEPRGWQRSEWPDEEVARAAADPQLRAAAWAASKSHAQIDWKATWKRRQQKETTIQAVFAYSLMAIPTAFLINIPWLALIGLAGVLSVVGYLIWRRRIGNQPRREPRPVLREESAPPKDDDSPRPLFVVERAPSQHLIARGTGLVILAGAVILAVTAIVEGGPLAVVGVTMWLSTLGVLGAVIFVWALSVGRARIVGFDDHLVVRPGLRRSRVVPASEIASLASLSAGRLRGRDARGRTLFTTMSVYDDFPDLAAWLKVKTPQQWADLQQRR
ncbi:hypothetical protein SAMN04487788_2319 [Microbacterium testaceum StLB037]|uniref:Uncharacterized protein n=1 Tax=Microbacterium testaceum (strain StLB037) TaxID=979556 RepID=A0A1H0Q9R7_MICTS|nr:hypothetical protein [Microbacterium testaceum]SDP14064.1 hypothetical protein SAMN04487788_2319 [Microbacterium testaceum StLB037]